MEYLTSYSTAIDLWSVGCIFAEMLGGGNVLFPGKNSKHQLDLITDIIGPPSAEAIEKLRNPGAKRVLWQFIDEAKPRRPLHRMFANSNELAVDLLSKMLCFDPDERISALEALNHPYFQEYRHLGLGAIAEPLPPSEFAFERKTMTPGEMRQEFVREILHYHPDVSEEILANWGVGGGVKLKSAVESFGTQMDGVIRMGSSGPLSQTLEERVLEGITEDRGRGGYAPHRHHVTMSESELGRYNGR